MNAVRYTVEFENFGARIRESRLREPTITQRDLATAVGISQAKLVKIEKGLVLKLDALEFFRLADALAENVRWLLVGHTHSTAINLRADPAPTPPDDSPPGEAAHPKARKK